MRYFYIPSIAWRNQRKRRRKPAKKNRDPPTEAGGWERRIIYRSRGLVCRGFIPAILGDLSPV